MQDKRSGEKHRADVLTPFGLAVEFQHSFLDPAERRSRESFYQSLVWLVDGTRRKNDYKRLIQCWDELRIDGKPGRYTLANPGEYIPAGWLQSKANVVFDFKGLQVLEDINDKRNFLYAVHPASDMWLTHIFILTRESFIDNIINGRWFLNS